MTQLREGYEQTSYLGRQGGDSLIGLAPDILDLPLKLGAVVFQFAVSPCLG